HATGQHTNVLARRLLYKGKLPSDDGIIAANLMPFSALTTPAPCRKFQLTFVRHLRCILTGYASPPFPVTVERLDPADARKKADCCPRQQTSPKGRTRRGRHELFRHRRYRLYRPFSRRPPARSPGSPGVCPDPSRLGVQA